MFQVLQISEHEWLQIPIYQRNKLVEIFKIPQTAFTHVSDGKVVTDGHTNADLAHISIEAMQDYLNSDVTDFVLLFRRTLMKIDGVEELPPLANPSNEVLPVITPEELLAGQPTTNLVTNEKTETVPQVKGGVGEGDKPSDGDKPKAGEGEKPVVPAAPRKLKVHRGRKAVLPGGVSSS